MSLESHNVPHADAACEEVAATTFSSFGNPLDAAREQAHAHSLPYAGSVNPPTAWAVVQDGLAVLVDVRTAEERKFVGHVPGSLHVPWATGTSLTRNPRFVKELETRIGGKEVVVLLLCRSGNRSAAAAAAAHAAGFLNVFNVSEGFEGDINETGQRGHLGGWRYAELPWVQD